MINYFKDKGLPLFFLIFNLPLVQFFHENNLKQILLNDLINIFFYHFLLFIFFFISIVVFYNKFQIKINKKAFFLTSFIFYYLIFYYYLIKNGILYFSSNYINLGILLDVIIFILYLTIFFYFLYFLKKEKIFYIFKIFLIFFLTLNYFVFLKEITKIYHNNKNQQNLVNNEHEMKLNKANIYYIIFDGMISLDNAKQNNFIKDKQKVIENFNKKKAKYLENSISNYSTSYLSIASILQADYPIKENDIKYKNRFNFFPYNLTNNNNDIFLLDALKKVKKNFIWIGNDWATCKDNNKKYLIKCTDNKNNGIQILTKFYSSTPFKKLFYSAFYNPQDVKFLNNTETFLNSIISENNFYFIHLLIPHDTILNKECAVNKNEKKVSNKENYKIQYNCSINKISEILDLINKKDKNEKIIIISADHGWSFLKSENINNEKYNQERSEIFNLIQAPDRCNQEDWHLEIKSPINNIRFALNCIHNMNLPYLKNKHFISFYESSEKYGKVIELK